VNHITLHWLLEFMLVLSCTMLYSTYETFYCSLSYSLLQSICSLSRKRFHFIWSESENPSFPSIFFEMLFFAPRQMDTAHLVSAHQSSTRQLHGHIQMCTVNGPWHVPTSRLCQGTVWEGAVLPRPKLCQG